MSRFQWSRGRVLVVAGVVAGLAIPALATSSAAASEPAGAQEWASRYNGPGNSFDGATAVAVSPDGNTVFVTGRSGGSDNLGDYATVAYDATTGVQEWASRYDGPGHDEDQPEAIAVSPDGGTVFVTGYSDGTDLRQGYATIAYNAATGAQLWLKRFDGTGTAISIARSLVVSHDGSAIYVTGYTSSGGSPGNDYLTIAYSAATGATLWTSRYNGPAHSNDQGRAVAISPDDKTVYVTGRSTGVGFDTATIAYNAATGARRWASRYNNGKANGDEFANAIAVGPGGQTVYITGGSTGKTSAADFVTIAYRAALGAQLWVKRYNGPANFSDLGSAVAVTASGSTVIMTGSSWGKAANGENSSNTDYATIAYSAATGAAKWTRRYATEPTGYAFDNPAGLVISPDGSKVYVTGDSENVSTEDDYGTVAYSVATGAQLWASLYDGPQHSFDAGAALALSPSGDRLYVVGWSTGSDLGDFATVAYQT